MSSLIISEGVAENIRSGERSWLTFNRQAGAGDIEKGKVTKFLFMRSNKYFGIEVMITDVAQAAFDNHILKDAILILFVPVSYEFTEESS